jgi:hypothetical protein
MTVVAMSDVEDVLAALPERDLRPDEATSAARALGASALSRVTYDREDGEMRVLIVFLWWDRDPVGLAGSLSYDDVGGWDLDHIGRTDHAGFLDAVDSARVDLLGDDDSPQGEVIEFGPGGEVVDSWERDL